ncbi:MAG: dihydrofolate reductase [Gemmataceae bacterium]|jgi:dihydrofolate reductase|nr:dihydrofolate reductase [Gemmataceae bacterium]
MILSAIVAIGPNLVIGSQGKLPWHLPNDLKRFRKLTMGKPILMGRTTFASLGKPLEGRQNIVLSRTPQPIEGVTCVSSMEEALERTQNAPEVMVIGGKQVYELFLNQIQRLYLTIVQGEFSGDTFFPKSIAGTWTLKESTYFPKDEKNPYDSIFQIWEKQSEFGTWEWNESLLVPSVTSAESKLS